MLLKTCLDLWPAVSSLVLPNRVSAAAREFLKAGILRENDADTDNFDRPLYLSLFYDRTELALRLSLLLGMSPLANCFAGALAYGITHIKGTLEPWRWLFIIEGAPTGRSVFLRNAIKLVLMCHSPLCSCCVLLPSGFSWNGQIFDQRSTN